MIRIGWSPSNRPYEYIEPEPTDWFYVEDRSGSTNTLQIVKTDNTAFTLSVEYSNNGENWQTLGSTSTTAITTTIPANGKVYLRCETYRWGKTNSYFNTITATGSHAVGGNILSLIYGSNFDNQTEYQYGLEYMFTGLFCNSTTLVDAGDLVIPMSSAAPYIFMRTFKGCTNLLTAPNLPATNLSDYCYEEIFFGCTKLVNIPSTLPAESVPYFGYRFMFYECSSITHTPEIKATTLGQASMDYMFSGCTSLTTVNRLVATTVSTSSCRGMFSGCTALVTVPSNLLPATTLANQCYTEMFVNCTALTTAPNLPATTIADGCYNTMFKGCTALVNVPSILPAETLAASCYSSMFYGCSSLVSAPILPAKTLEYFCYNQMFIYCSSLKEVTSLAIDINATNCLKYWLRYVSAEGTFTKDPEMSSWPTGVSGIPSGWTVEDYK